MNKWSGSLRRMALSLAMAGTMLFQASQSQAADLNLADTPLFLDTSVAPLNMLVMGRDHKLYYEAYNDASDLNSDGTLDVGYKPTQIDYYGYFDSFKCYTYNGTNFVPAAVTANKKCAGQWSGDFLNYLTTSRMDALRKVLYGGSRWVDTNSNTILQRSHVPQDAHSWGKEYESIARDGYDITEYTPYGLPMAGSRHLFANTTLLQSGSGEPRLRVLLNRAERIWEWVSIERPVAGSNTNIGGMNMAVTPTDFFVRVQVCTASLPEVNCRNYPSGSRKPIGLLQEFGENDSMYFGLLTGSYEKNTSGGVLRKNVGSLTNEVDPSTGQFTGTVGVIGSIDRLTTLGFGGNYYYNQNCGWITTRPINEGECRMWGSPTAEMMYETLRYFAGKASPTAAFDTNGGDDGLIGLPDPSWQDPYSNYPRCAKPFQTVVSDINPSYDTDQLPGSFFSAFGGDVSGLDVSSIAQTIWDNEFGAAGLHFIGQSGANYDGAPTPKTVTSFGTIRGLAPEDPTKEGGYYAGSVSHFGLVNDVNPIADEQNLQTFAVALASPLPRIEIPVAGTTVTLVPFAKSAGGCLGVVGTQGLFQPTNTIVDFYVESITPTSGRFRVNFEDVEQGADHDMDAIVLYEYTVNGNNTVTINLTSEYAAGCIIQHMGYVISGTTADGTYLEVRDVDTGMGSDPDYFLDTPPGQPPGGMFADGVDLPLAASRTFTPGATPGATLLRDPLWYAAKWGGFIDQNANDLPDQQAEWDDDGDGDPDNYFLVTNALNLANELRDAFKEIIDRVASAASASVNSGSISTDTRLYQARFNSGNWTGELLSFPINTDGSLGALEWNARDVMPVASLRELVTTDITTGQGIPFQWASLPAVQQAMLDPFADGRGQDRADYLHGDQTQEVQNGGPFRDRTHLLGDIISSSPVFVGKPPFLYPDALESQPYSTFRTNNANRPQTVWAGGNDGIVHAFDASNGQEIFGFFPGEIFQDLHFLTDPSYNHRFFVDGSPNSGDAFYAGAWHTVLLGGLIKGGQGIYALDITDPSALTEANASSIVLWEFTDGDDADVGYTFSQPAIVRMANGRWAAVFGNGYNNTVADGNVSGTGDAALFIVDIETGSLIRKINTQAGIADDPTGLGRPNGLNTPAVVDFDGDFIADYIFAGDLFGNLWKFDIRSTTAANWDSAFSSGGIPQPLYVARDAGGIHQPITSRPEVGRGPGGAGMIVLFGTGKYLEAGDKDIANLTEQTFYGIIDRNSGTSSDQVAGRIDLQQQDILDEQIFIFTDAQTGLPVSIPLRVTSNTVPIAGTDGWFLDLVSPVNGFEGEMQVTNSILRNGRIIFTTLIPDPDACGFGGDGWIMELDALTGSRLDNTPFDLNNDQDFDTQDYVTVTINGTPMTIPVSGRKSEVGIIPTPGILAGQGIEYKYTPGTSGNIQVTAENPGVGGFGRQSWRHIR